MQEIGSFDADAYKMKWFNFNIKPNFSTWNIYS